MPVVPSLTHQTDLKALRSLASFRRHSGLDRCLHLYLSGYWVRQLNVNVDNIWNEMTGFTQLTCLAIGGQVII
jgi:hypothetical protein